MSDHVRSHLTVGMKGATVMSLINSGVVLVFIAWGTPVQWFNLALAGGGFTAAAWCWFIRREVEVGHDRAETKGSETQTHCTDCGKAFSMLQRQAGFDPATGKPRYDYSFGCPDGSPIKMKPGYARMSMYSLYGDPYVWPNCGERKSATSGVPTGHAHPEQVSTDCPTCIKDMLDNKIIDLPAAKKLLKA